MSCCSRPASHPAIDTAGWMPPELQSVCAAFRALRDSHLPHPALVLDRWWDVVDRNDATDILLAGCAPQLLEPPVNAIRLTLHPDGLSKRILNLGQWRAHLLSQVQNRAEHTGDARLQELLVEFRAYQGDHVGVANRSDVLLPLQLSVGTQTLSFFSIAARVETATDVTVDELQLEAFYPGRRSHPGRDAQSVSSRRVGEPVRYRRPSVCPDDQCGPRSARGRHGDYQQEQARRSPPVLNHRDGACHGARQEARRRVDEGMFCGHLATTGVSLVPCPACRLFTFEIRPTPVTQARSNGPLM